MIWPLITCHACCFASMDALVVCAEDEAEAEMTQSNLSQVLVMHFLMSCIKSGFI